MRGRALLEATMRQIMDHPEVHDQSQWFNSTDCGTAACFAGWACLLTGFRPLHHGMCGVVNYLGHTVSAHEVAMSFLGIDQREAAILFDPDNTREMLQHMVKDLVNGTKLRQPRQYVDYIESIRIEESHK